VYRVQTIRLINMSDTQVDINTVVINETKNQESDENDSSKSLNRRKRCLLDAQHRRNVGLDGRQKKDFGS
jgi:hypothetical protein